ncbi:Uncharacterised protein [Mycobacteroides abscessus]|nr:Uncharacterised protein [Mycobacteroides abscessus]
MSVKSADVARGTAPDWSSRYAMPTTVASVAARTNTRSLTR